MAEQEATQASKGPDARHLPSLLPPASLLLRRSQTTLGLLRDVVQESSAEYWYERGKKASEGEDWIAASYAFECCLALDSLHWRGQLQLSATYAYQRSARLAAVTLLNFFESSHTNYIPFEREIGTKALNDLGKLFEEFNNEFAPDFDNLLALSFIYWITDSDSGYGALEKFKPKMRDTLELAQQIFPADVTTSAIWHRLSGALWHHSGRFRVENTIQNNRALEEFDEAILLYSTNASVYIDRANIKAKLKNLTGAFLDYEYAIKLFPKFIDAYINRGLVKQRSGDLIGAILDFDHAINITPSTAYNYALRASAKIELQDYAGSIIDCDHAISLQSWCQAAYVTRARAKSIIGDLKGASADSSRAGSLARSSDGSNGDY